MSENINYFPPNLNPPELPSVLRFDGTPAEWRHLDAGHLATLAREIMRRVAQPVDSLEIAALLESMGLTDEVATRRYGARDTFDLAEAVLDRLKATGLPSKSKEREPKPQQPRSQALIDYVRGPLALVPVVVLLLTITAYRELGRWGQNQILALTLGMTCSMLFTNGFIQAASRRGAIYLSRSNPGAANRFLRVTMTIAGACIVVLTVLVVLFTTRLGLFTPEEGFIFGLALVGLSAIWLMVAVLGLVQAPGWLGAGLAAGLVAGLVVDRAVELFSGPHLAAGTVVGFAVAMGLMLRAVHRAFAAPGAGYRPGRVSLPPVAYMVHEAAPYFAYGSLYMVFILLPHVLGWMGALAAGDERMWAVNSLEVGLTLSLAPIILSGGVAEHAARLFWGRALAGQAATPGDDPGRFGRLLTEFYWQQLRRYLIVLASTSIAAYAALRVALSTGLLASWLRLSSLGAMQFVFQASLVAYFLLGWGLFNCMFSVTLARPELALRAVKVGMVVTVITGLPLALGVNYSYAAIAFIAGALAFVVASSWTINQVFKAADYYYFSSF